MPLLPEVEAIIFPEIEPFNDGYLKVSDLHEIFWTSYGNPDGVPVVCLHGGPGSGMSSWHPRLFDPSKYHIILFDQRGCGQSKPFAELAENTTPHLIEDMEKLRQHLNIKAWHLFGGSWGSTLALAYAHAHPDSVLGLLIYGIFLAREKEAQMLYSPNGPAALMFPDYYQQFIEPLSEEERGNPAVSYGRLFDSADPKVKQDAVLRWSRWELSVMDMIPDDEFLKAIEDEMAFLMTHSLFEYTYFRHNGYIDAVRILDEIGDKLAGKPVYIAQGRYDLICPPITAFEVHKAIPHSELHMISLSGHTGKNLESMQTLFDLAKRLSA